MIKTKTYELLHDHAERLLQELENMNIIRAVARPTENTQRLSDKYFGIWTEEEGAAFDEYTRKSREEWPKNF